MSKSVLCLGFYRRAVSENSEKQTQIRAQKYTVVHVAYLAVIFRFVKLVCSYISRDFHCNIVRLWEKITEALGRVYNVKGIV